MMLDQCVMNWIGTLCPGEHRENCGCPGSPSFRHWLPDCPRGMRTDDELRQTIRKMTWYHSIELRPGIITPGHVNERYTLSALNLPPDLTGKTVLDIGCWDGYY